MLARVGWTPQPLRTRSKAKARPRRLNHDRRRRLVETTVAIMREAIERGAPSKFALESVCRHGIRSALCLQGWPWDAADFVAMGIVAEALSSIGAKRPAWKEGQPEWTQEGFSPIERTRCIRCGWKLPEGALKFCGSLCAVAHHQAIARITDAEATAARNKAWFAAWSAKQDEKTCPTCQGKFRPRYKATQKFCSNLCADRFRRHDAPWNEPGQSPRRCLPVVPSTAFGYAPRGHDLLLEDMRA